MKGRSLDFFPNLLFLHLTEQHHSLSSSVQSLSCVQLFATPWTAACQASLSITNSRSPPKPMSIEAVMLSTHLTLCCPLLLLSSIFPSIRVFSNESALRIRWPKIGVSVNTQDWSPLGWTGWISMQFKPNLLLFSPQHPIYSRNNSHWLYSMT